MTVVIRQFGWNPRILQAKNLVFAASGTNYKTIRLLGHNFEKVFTKPSLSSLDDKRNIYIQQYGLFGWHWQWVKKLGFVLITNWKVNLSSLAGLFGCKLKMVENICTCIGSQSQANSFVKTYPERIRAVSCLL